MGIKGQVPWNKGKTGVYTKAALERFRQAKLKNPVKFWKGKKRSDMMGDKNPKWLGDDVSYVALHQWVKRTLGTPNTCEFCGFASGSNYKIHWANLSGKYQRVESDWIRLCVPCHSKFDKERKSIW